MRLRSIAPAFLVIVAAGIQARADLVIDTTFPLDLAPITVPVGGFTGVVAVNVPVDGHFVADPFPAYERTQPDYFDFDINEVSGASPVFVAHAHEAAPGAIGSSFHTEFVVAVDADTLNAIAAGKSQLMLEIDNPQVLLFTPTPEPSSALAVASIAAMLGLSRLARRLRPR